MDTASLTLLWGASVHNPEFKKAIEEELKLRIEKNKNFSREYFFKVCTINNHAITLKFIPTSNSFKNYGEHVTITIILDANEVKELMNNYSSDPPINTYGQLKAKLLVTDDHTPEQIQNIATNGFNTGDIFEVLTTSLKFPSK